MEDLKKCPFCGGEGVLFASPEGGICVKCFNCGVSTRSRIDVDTFSRPTNAVEKVISEWNKRVE